ncbi:MULTISPECIES: response regulator transcription factor [unclassified Wenzhouxiangella]|uniref:response regulator transcription factor n=1 Tax=unclassified Wenzhouxiangella TaxID=2613841 RepID=UPI000E325F6C|nr:MULTISPECIES: response regulator [unclassified Wenzhouxiangella]RFF26861.1 DNA-binding response regulator [Wenzhouxiangella sp. 15181]RFP68485.1 DNA-binding response regulator [Wenzhouxiangella sp. 15190]
MATEARGEKGTVVIVDDDGPVRESLSLLLDTAGFDTRCHRSGEDLLDCGPPDGPACLLLDLEMPGMKGTEVQKRLADADWSIPIVFLTGHGDVPAAVNALKTGAVDFLQKNQLKPGILLDRIEKGVAEHKRRMLDLEASNSEKERISRLTVREFEVAQLASSGLTNKAIGLELGISERTVEIHRGRAMKKLALRTAADLARMKPAFESSAPDS